MVAVFRFGHVALQGITTPPSAKQVLDFYAKIVDEESCPLGMLTQWAASEHQGGRALDFILLAGAFVYFLQRRMQAFSYGCARNSRDGHVCAHLFSRTSQECSMLLRGHILATLDVFAGWRRLLGRTFSFGLSAWSIRARRDPSARGINRSILIPIIQRLISTLRPTTTSVGTGTPSMVFSRVYARVLANAARF